VCVCVCVSSFPEQVFGVRVCQCFGVGQGKLTGIPWHVPLPLARHRSSHRSRKSDFPYTSPSLRASPLHFAALFLDVEYDDDGSFMDVDSMG
jgi:hypothetical protein